MTIELNQIYNVDSALFMQSSGAFADLVITSPPYNTSRSLSSDKYNSRYDNYVDSISDAEYLDWTVGIFNGFDNVLRENGVVLYNLSYSTENTTLMFLAVAEIIKRTDFTLADSIVWKKSSAIPNNRSANKLTRICEYVFVFCRKSEFKSFNANKEVVSVIERTGQRNFANVYNFIEAKNNDKSTPLNKATYSTDLCEKLLKIYAKPNSVLFDPFMGTGTTGVAAKKNGHSFVGCELSEAQCEYAVERIAEVDLNERF